MPPPRWCAIWCSPPPGRRRRRPPRSPPPPRASPSNNPLLSTMFASERSDAVQPQTERRGGGSPSGPLPCPPSRRPTASPEEDAPRRRNPASLLRPFAPRAPPPNPERSPAGIPPAPPPPRRSEPPSAHRPRPAESAPRALVLPLVRAVPRRPPHLLRMRPHLLRVHPHLLPVCCTPHHPRGGCACCCCCCCCCIIPPGRRLARAANRTRTPTRSCRAAGCSLPPSLDAAARLAR